MEKKRNGKVFKEIERLVKGVGIPVFIDINNSNLLACDRHMVLSCKIAVVDFLERVLPFNEFNALEKYSGILAINFEGRTIEIVDENTYSYRILAELLGEREIIGRPEGYVKKAPIITFKNHKTISRFYNIYDIKENHFDPHCIGDDGKSFFFTEDLSIVVMPIIQ